MRPMPGQALHIDLIVHRTPDNYQLHEQVHRGGNSQGEQAKAAELN